MELARRCLPAPRRGAGGAPVRRAALRRRDRPRTRLAGRLAAADSPAALVVGRPGSCVQPVGLRPRIASHAFGQRRDRQVAGGGSAVVHDGLRSGHADHLPPDAALRARACADRARGSRRPPGHGGQRADRRRAGQDRPRGPPWQGRPQVARPVLRHRRRDAALPHPPVRSVALDRRRGTRTRSQGAGARGFGVDRQVRRLGRRRVRRIRAAHR